MQAIPEIRIRTGERPANPRGQFVLYWLTRTDPIPESQRDAAQILGQRRFEFFIDQVARRVASDEPLSKRALSASAADDLND